MIGTRESVSQPRRLPRGATSGSGAPAPRGLAEPEVALDQQGRMGTALPRPPLPVVYGAGKRPPSSAELVEHYDTGKLYLRAYVQGRYIWQEVMSDDPAAVEDTGTWIVDSALQDAYWLNHGTYRRRAGKFRSVERQAPAA
jgi:hypothetical protein